MTDPAPCEKLGRCTEAAERGTLMPFADVLEQLYVVCVVFLAVVSGFRYEGYHCHAEKLPVHDIQAAAACLPAYRFAHCLPRSLYSPMLQFVRITSIRKKRHEELPLVRISHLLDLEP